MRATLALTPCQRTSMERMEPFRSLQPSRSVRPRPPTCHNWPFSPHSPRAKKRAENLARPLGIIRMEIGSPVSPVGHGRRVQHLSLCIFAAGQDENWEIMARRKRKGKNSTAGEIVSQSTWDWVVNFGSLIWRLEAFGREVGGEPWLENELWVDVGRRFVHSWASGHATLGLNLA